MLDGKAPNYVAAERLNADPKLANPAPHGRAGPCDTTKARLIVDAAKEVSQPNSPGGRAGFLAASMVTFAVLGSVLEGIPAIVLLGPLLLPAARALGVHDAHYAMTAVLAMALGLSVSPFGVGFCFSCAIGGAAPDEAWTRVWPYLGTLLLAVVVVAAFPWLSVGFP